MPSFLLIDDDEANAQLLRRALSEDGLSGIDIASDGEQALSLSGSTQYNVIILELEIPKIDGLTVLRGLREKGISVPVLVLSRRAAVADRVQALWAGADDYLCKPFELEELQARLRALSRRAPSQVLKLRIADLEMDILQRSVRRAGKRIDLCKKEFAILEYLMRNIDCPVARDQLVDHVWGGNFEGLTNIVDVYINYLRRKIDQDFENRLIHTVRGTGYMISTSIPRRESRHTLRIDRLEKGGVQLARSS
jgi:DNA-binding response OmpR family regulator